jgi:hypothetical protein
MSDRREEVAERAMLVLGRQISGIREQFAVHDGDPVWFGVLPGERDGSYVVAMKSSAGWSAAAVVDITITDAVPEKEEEQ